MTQYAMALDLNRCVGCLACVVACKMENNVQIGSYWNKVLRVDPIGNFPTMDMYWLPVLCQHCESPECTRVCPTGASYKREDGIVLIDKSKCIGCQYCAMACPYGVRYFNEEERVVEKCTLCAHLIERGERPTCVEECTGDCRHFGDLDDPHSEISRFLQEAGDDVHIVADVGNHPSFKYILRRHTWRSG
ncbi:MAG: 4Fe-4S dicluster domain-containing protein [Anaerolineaceae bacterium]|nr:4Fe-4S dicluster domain-containing protein [Anaerolineaceae bacterium]